MMNEGLWALMHKPNRITIPSKEPLDLFRFTTPRQNRGIVIQTGLVGMHMLEIAFNNAGRKDVPRYWSYVPSRGRKRWMELTLFQKHSLYKIRIDMTAAKGSYRYYAIYGTTVVAKTTTQQEAIDFLTKLKTKHERRIYRL